MNPLDLYTKPWTGWDSGNDQANQAKGDASNPFLDAVWNDIKDQLYQPMSQAMSQYFVDSAVQNNLICSATGKAILPVVELVCDNLV